MKVGYFAVGIGPTVEPERIKTIGLGNLFGNGRALLRAGGYSKDQYSEQQKADYRYAARLLHGVPSSNPT